VMSINMKGLLKGLRYISQIFEEEEEEKEIQIGFPTDVKHVAHIGWDGPSVNSPSWVSPGNASSAPNEEPVNKDVEEVNGAPQVNPIIKQENAVKESPGRERERDMPGLPKSSRRQPSVESIGSADSPIGSPNHKSKSSRRRQKQKETTTTSSPRGGGGGGGGESSSSQSSLPNIPKKSRRKKSKDGDGSGSGSGSLKSSSKSKEKDKDKEKGSKHGSKYGSDDGSITKQLSGEANSTTSISSLKE
ncbi:CRIB domain-containing protein RIC6, partial [Bienertia sinuspersici]